MNSYYNSLQNHMRWSKALNMRLASWFLILLLLTSCSLHDTSRSSILVIAIDSLPSDSLTCSETDEPGLTSFSSLCSESVRFTHAYTTSTLTLPALSSVLTGLYPHESRVFHNGSNSLSSKVETVAEAAAFKKYHTSFISGGAPIFRRSGFSQGFDFFDDNITVNQDQIYRPIGSSVKIFLQWLDKEAKRNPFFSVIYAADLQFTDVSTRNEIGETRAATFTGQFHEIDESLALLIAELKKRDIWDNTYVFLVGLNGVSPFRRITELPGTNLYTENTLVPLLVKSAGKKRDRGVQWKVDDNVSLIDVGATLYDVIGVPIPRRDEELPSLSFKEALTQKEQVWPKRRPLLIESNWASWRALGSAKFALVQDQYLEVFNGRAHVYNTLVDRMQTASVSSEAAAVDFRDINVSISKRLGIFEFTNPLYSEVEKYQLARSLWSHGGVTEQNTDDLKLLLAKRENDMDVLNWNALVALERRNWKLLNQLGSKIKKAEWEYVSRVHLGVKPSKLDRGCYALLDISNDEFLQRQNECDDGIFLELVTWMHEPQSSPNAQIYFERFLRSYRTYLVDRKILMMNYSLGYVWETLTKGLLQPQLVELFMSLPENVRLKAIVDKRLASEDQ